MSYEITRCEGLDEMLNEIYDEVIICGCSFSPADILANLDPIAYRQAYLDGGYEEEEDETV